MKKIRNVLGVVVLSAVVSFAVVRFTTSNPIMVSNDPVTNQNVEFASLNTAIPTSSTDFVEAAELTVNAVVHVTTESVDHSRDNYSNDPFYQFFYGRPMPPQAVKASGSGVIISTDGYIVTNNHVVQNAETIEVALNDKQYFKAEVIGLDPTTDLALLKIEANEMPYVNFGNSEEVKVGEWVLAVGNPFNLTSTVTAGIVSAKGRNINIIGADPRTGGSAIESFIQTDAAVNPGNSGGALVNTRGELIGINSAIQSTTGSYVGYSFAIPSNIVKKVVEDLKEYGAVQRAYIGVSIRDIDKKLADELGLTDMKGVYVQSTFDQGAAADAGIKKGDVIVKVGSVSVNKTAELQEQISQFRPGDEVMITLKRSGDEIEKTMVLKNIDGTTQLIKKEQKEMFDQLGARFEDLEKEEMDKLNLTGGAKVVKIWSGKLMKAGVQEGFIITRIDKQAIKGKADVIKYLEGKKGGVLLEGVYPNGKEKFYGFGM
jgi:Do/DeqQ family serine protease